MREAPLNRRRGFGLRVRGIKIQLRYVAAYSANVLSVGRVSKRIVVDLNFGLTMLYLLGVPQLRHEDIDCTVFGLIAGSVEDRYSKNDGFVLCASFNSNRKNSLFAFQLGLAIPDGGCQP